MAERIPMLDQYRAVKARHRDAILFFRLGDFYEMFFEDAIEASALLDLTLTRRQSAPMCGVPHHAARSYIARLLKLGKRIAVCEQLSEPGAGKGIVERDVVEVVTPGTTVEEDFLEQGSNNYLVAACRSDLRGGGGLSLAYLELSTGEFRAFSCASEGSAALAQELRAELYRLAPREMLVQQSLLEDAQLAEAIGEIEGLVVSKYPDWSFDPASASADIARRFGAASLKGFGFDEAAPEIAAAGVLLRYVDETARSASPQLSPPTPYRGDEYVSVDEGSRRNLEIVRNMADGGRAFSLISILDWTRTAPGSRLLKQWLLQPLRSREAVEARLEAVDCLYRDQRLLAELRESLGTMRDIERLASKVAMDKANARDLLALAESIRSCEASGAILSGREAGGRGEAGDLPAALAASAEETASLAEALEAALLVEGAIKEEPSILLTEGELIRDGYSAELDRLRGLKADSSGLLEAYIEEEKEATGIPNLRVRFNRIIGYYIEVSKGKIDSVPKHFIRRQSLVAGERYTTNRLAELESEINGATERIVELERRLFLEVRDAAKSKVSSILKLGRAWAARDCLQSFAQAATVRGYSRPRLSDTRTLRIAEGRHPVVEAHLPSGSFVPNGIRLDASGRPEAAGAASASSAPKLGEAGGAAASEAEPAFALITGPNMAGKSTFLRQTALIALMAQAGSFVPAMDAEIGMVDKIFCRVGAQDNLARGESTFLVEMHETAFILNTATDRSLVIMDEVGRGTSTIDGLAIAWSVSESLLDSIRCRTLFATHYHELTALEHPRLRNYSLAVLEEDERIVFLKKLEEKPAAGSYGIHVAALAGLPAPVLARAREIQASLEAKERGLAEREASAFGPSAASEGREAGARGASARASSRKPAPAAEATLFSPGDLALAELASLDIDKLSPLEALNWLASIKKRLAT